MKAATTISGAGTFNIGTLATPIPFAVKFTLTGGSGWYVQGSGGLTMGVYGAEPTYTYAKLSGAESAGATRLEIDTDLTGDIWTVGDTIHVININAGRDCEIRTISAITSTYIDVSVGITNSKLSGSYVLLINRNITITTTTHLLRSFASGKLVIASGSLNGNSIFFSCVGLSITGGVFYNITGTTYAFDACSNFVINGGIFSNNTYSISGCANITITNALFCGGRSTIYSSVQFYVNGGIFIGNTYITERVLGITVTSGIFMGNTAILYYSNFTDISGGSFSGNAQILYLSSATITGATFTNNTYDVRESQFTSFNQSLTSTVENYLYANLSRNTYSESIDHDGTAGAFKSWTKGGVTTSVATPVPTGFTRSYQLAPENATVKGFFNRRVNVPAGKTITLTLYLRKNASMTYLPRVWVHKLGTEPFTTAGDILHTFTMTNANDAWETDTFSYTNTADYDVELNCRFVAMAATGYVYGQVLDLVVGGVSRSRILGGM
jgi:hypothetical protein